MSTVRLGRARGETLRTVMQPVLARILTEQADARRTHALCTETIYEAQRNAIDARTIPLGQPSVYISGTFAPVVVVRAQIKRVITPWGVQYRVTDAYLPPVVTLGAALVKPYVWIFPIAGLTSDNWQAEFPGFHYTTDSNGLASVCTGKTFKIGDATTLADEIGALEDVLSVANQTDSYTKLGSLALEHGPDSLWAVWDRALGQATMNVPQGVFIRDTMLKF